MKKVSIILLCILTCFIQLYSVTKHAHWTFIQNMAEKSAESCVSLKGNDKAFFNSSKCYKGNGGYKKGAMVNQNIWVNNHLKKILQLKKVASCWI